MAPRPTGHGKRKTEPDAPASRLTGSAGSREPDRRRPSAQQERPKPDDFEEVGPAGGYGGAGPGEEEPQR
jgi:hypothetical protein